MSITVKKGSVKTSTYEVSGDTLADIWADIEKKGPKPKGEVRAGDTLCSLNMDPSSSKIETTFKEEDGEVTAEAKMTKGTLTYDCSIKAPKLKSDKKLSKDAKTEWARFMKELTAHENEHVADFGKTATQLGKDIDALTATGTGPDKKTAHENAVKEYTKVYNADYSKAKMDGRMQDGADALDSGGHGPTLKTSIK